jgi:hypothetical protein
MPRKPAAALGVVPVGSAPREPPPASLGPEEAKEWRWVTESLPAHWFPGASFVLLEVYVRAVVSMRWLAAQVDQHPRGSPGWAKWQKLYDKEARLVAQLALRLRLHPRWERTTLKAVPSGVRPWHLAGGGDAPPASKFKGWDYSPAKERKGDGDEPPPEQSS